MDCPTCRTPMRASRLQDRADVLYWHCPENVEHWEIRPKHKHEYILGSHGKVEVCQCGAFQFVGEFTPIIEVR